MRILIAGLIGGLVMFMWGAVAHMALPIGEMGVKIPAQQEAALDAIGRSSTGAGVYMYPSMPMEDWSDADKAKAFGEQVRGKPSAFVVYQPNGNPAAQSMTPNLVKQFLAVTAAALLVAWVMALGAWGFSRRLLIAGAMGLFSWLTISLPYWNWYMFPLDFTIANLIEQVVGWLLAGAAMAWWLGRGDRTIAQVPMRDPVV